MAAPTNERGTQKLRFLDWLINQINSGRYEGLYWLDENHTTFCIPWKHNSRKNLVENDYRIFQEWAVVSRKYNEDVPDPARWKTNFRCALRSTKRFEEVKSGDSDYHVYRIIPCDPSAAPPANPPADANKESDLEDDQLRISPYNERPLALHKPAPLKQQEIDVVFDNLSLENSVPVPDQNAAENFYPCSGDVVPWVMQQVVLNEMQEVSWAPVPAVAPDLPLGAGTCTTPVINQNGCLPLGNGVVNELIANNYCEGASRWLAANPPNVNSQPVATHLLQHAQQNSPPGINQANSDGEALCDNNHFIENVFMNEEHGVMSNVPRNQLLTNQQAMTEQNTFAPPVVPSPPEQPPLNAAAVQNNVGSQSLNLNVSIYYRGKLMHEGGVELSSCWFTYNQHYHTLGNPQMIPFPFPDPEILPDRKQVRHTLTLLNNADLLLYQKNKMICARRLGRCRVFWAFSKELDNMAERPQPKLLQRDVDTEIFNYEKFYQELMAFCDGRKCSSPDYTIYLCFGQSLSAEKPKESKLILVKLVPVACRQYHEVVLREGVSSLNSDISLQLSNSLFDLIERYIQSPNSMQTD
ncbi:interferon regulatory factor 7 isoform X2 [Rhineura floridana]|uniref:interferon regulatory factor 7 isoform X2 n=1 Tax=Rhineura floridana TaxID=261503 RepID=UPI002AC82FEC|nr:interferon regulatory factor 7 isoform X2 [Rhineura floridana]